MHSSKLSVLLIICMLFISSVSPILGCGSCGRPAAPKHKHHHHKGKHHKGPINLPPLPPVTVPPPKSPAPAPAATCPIDTLKLGACVDLLGGLVHIGLGDPVINQCCPLLQGLAEIEAAVCLCTTLKLKLLNLNIYVPLALQLLITCGKTPPPGYTCTL